MTAFTVDKIAGTAQCFTEPLEGLGKALPLDMVLIPGGSFEMGSPEDEPERSNAEGPRHTVTVPDFFMGRYPITQAQWRFVAGLGQVEISLEPDPSEFKGNNRPVETVSWYEAGEFCRRLANHSKRPYRLPSEAEREYACRASTTTPFAFGTTLTSEIANYRGSATYNDEPEGEYRQETTAVDVFGIANAFGLCDMHGNVDEWCADHWHDSYEDAPTDGNAWLTDDESASRVLRGGSWYDYPKLCRSAARYNGINPNVRDYGFGFRVCFRVPQSFTLLES